MKCTMMSFTLEEIQAEAKRQLKLHEEKEATEKKQAAKVALEDEQAKEEKIRNERIRLLVEDEQIRIRAQKMVLESEARQLAEKKEAAIQAELKRLKNRTPLEILEDKLSDMTEQFNDLRSDITGKTEHHVSHVNTNLENRFTELFQKQETQFLQYRSNIDKKIDDLTKSFEEKLQLKVLEHENKIWTGLHYFRTFRLRVLKRVGNVDYTNIGSISFKGAPCKTNLKHECIGIGHSYSLIYKDIYLKDAKVTYNGDLDTIEMYKDKIFTKNPNPIVHIRFPQPTLLTSVTLWKTQTGTNGPASVAYVHQGFPTSWIFEGSNDEAHWIELAKKDISSASCVCSNPSAYCPIHAYPSCSYGWEIYG